MDILTIAQREGDRAYAEAEGDEAKAEAYLQTVTATRERGKRAEEILEAGLVSPNGKGFYVESQNGNGRYTVKLETRECDCPDRHHRGSYCKHLIAAELFADGDTIEADGEQVILEVEAYARGEQLVDQKLTRVRVNGGGYREARTEDFDKALAWLRREGYEFVDLVRPKRTMGSVKARYFYRKGVADA